MLFYEPSKGEFFAYRISAECIYYHIIIRDAREEKEEQKKGDGSIYYKIEPSPFLDKFAIMDGYR
jgi:hypothetical protein